MDYKFLSTIEISALSAATGIGNVLEAKVGPDSVIVLLRMIKGDFVDVRALSRVAGYFGVSQEEVILNMNEKGILHLDILSPSLFTFNDNEVVLDGDEPWISSEEPIKKDGGYVSQCCGTGACPGCPSGR